MFQFGYSRVSTLDQEMALQLPPCAPPDVIGSSRIVHRAQRQTAPGWPEVTERRSGMHKGTERERIACRKTLINQRISRPRQGR